MDAVGCANNREVIRFLRDKLTQISGGRQGVTGAPGGIGIRIARAARGAGARAGARAAHGLSERRDDPSRSVSSGRRTGSGGRCDLTDDD